MRRSSALRLVLAAGAPPAAGAALADGWTIRAGGERAGPYTLSVFTDPTPVRAGFLDVSVLVQYARSDDVVQDARVLVAVEPVGRPGRVETFEATREQARNRLVYAAKLELPSEGAFRIGVRVAGPDGEGRVAFRVDATRATSLDRPLLLARLAALPALLVAWRLSGPRARRRA